MKKIISLLTHINVSFFKIIFILVLMISITSVSLISIYLLNKTDYSNVNSYATNTNTSIQIVTTTKAKVIKNTVSVILNNYPELKNIIEEASITIPVIDDFIPQGIALVDDNILITGYYEKNKNSKCYVLNKLGDIINIVELDTNSHVGSIAYDEINNLIWLPDNNGILNAYDSIDFLENSNVNAKYKFDNLSDDLIDFQNPNKKLISYLYIENKELYIGDFFIDDECTVKKYEIIFNNNGIDLKYVNSFKVPSRTQSITFVENNNKKYMILSRSYRRRNPSYIHIYEYNENTSNFNNLELVKIKVPPMLEQINIKDNLIYLLFESNAAKYWNCPEKIEYLLVGDINRIFNIGDDTAT